jgi:hypothetical protein
MHFVYVKVPLGRPRGRAFDALHHALQRELDSTETGSIVSWGASLPSAGAAEGDPGSFHRIDVELRELDSGLQLLREVLLNLKVSHGTELHFTVHGEALQQSLSSVGWGPRIPSTGTHQPRPPKGDE